MWNIVLGIVVAVLFWAIFYVIWSEPLLFQ